MYINNIMGFSITNTLACSIPEVCGFTGIHPITIATLFSLSDEVTLRLLNEELHEVFEWFILGLHLDLPPPDLHSIKHNPTLRSTEEFRTEMLSKWMTKLPKPSWIRVVKALMEIGRETLAQKISLKYGKATRLLFLCACIRSEWV